MQNPLLGVLITEVPIALKYGIVGAILGHEIGHTIIVQNLTDGFYPYFSEDVKNCIQDQFSETCRIYKEYNCTVEDKNFDENGSDIFGFPFAFERLKQIMGEKIHDKIPGSRLGLTHAQAYFHLVFSIGCWPHDVFQVSWIPHSASNIRTNAGVIQSPEFENVFNCPKNSRMVQSRKQFCHVLGEDAPQN
ncbi:unnamed protein product [Caenorhabditis angaria]|uniref:Peptidase M13 C-terminal domain-containing protein n=1 Tax=Caenorhabditis angaria TaxID=860376 RepID=A0A9P1IPK9_9PELO|nr:unnamed protein product [Caenorhabditis angaria]